MTRQNFFKYLTRAHRYLGLILGLQILIWFSSGFFMSFFDINQVRGKYVAEKAAFDFDVSAMVSVNDLPISTVKSIDIKGAVGGPIYKAITTDKVLYFDAATGKPWSGVTRPMAEKAAAKYYKGVALPTNIAKLETAPIEYRGSLPVWQISYEDNSKTRLYLDVNTGELRAVRTRLWRIFDFMWMLHIMDYDDRDDINNWWLWLCAAAASLFCDERFAAVVAPSVFKAAAF